MEWQACPSAGDALLGLLHPAWQASIGGCLLVVTVSGYGGWSTRPGPDDSALLLRALIVAYGRWALRSAARPPMIRSGAPSGGDDRSPPCGVATLTRRT